MSPELVRIWLSSMNLRAHETIQYSSNPYTLGIWRPSGLTSTRLRIRLRIRIILIYGNFQVGYIAEQQLSPLSRSLPVSHPRLVARVRRQQCVAECRQANEREEDE